MIKSHKLHIEMFDMAHISSHVNCRMVAVLFTDGNNLVPLSSRVRVVLQFAFGRTVFLLTDDE